MTVGFAGTVFECYACGGGEEGCAVEERFGALGYEGEICGGGGGEGCGEGRASVGCCGRHGGSDD